MQAHRHLSWSKWSYAGAETGEVSAIVKPLTIEAGATFEQPFVYREEPLAGEPPETGALINLTGWLALFTVTVKDAIVLQFTQASAEVTITPLSGLLVVSLTAEDTAKLPFKPYVDVPSGISTCHYTLSVTDPTGRVDYLVTGPITVLGR